MKGIKIPKWMAILGISLSLVETGASLLVPWFTKNLVDGLALSNLSTGIIILLGTAFILQTAAGAYSYYFLAYLGESIVASIRNKLWNQVLFLPTSYFDMHESGETMSRITQDTNIIKNLVTQHLITFLTGIISVIGSVAILLFIDWKMTVIMLGAVPIALLIIMPLGQKMYKISKATQDEMARFSGNLGRVLADIRLVKAYSAENSEEAKGRTAISQLFQYGLKEAKIQAIISPFMTFVMMLVLVILIGYGGVRVASGTLSAGSLVAIIIYMFQIVMPFAQMASFFTAFQKALGATERIQDILSLGQESGGKAADANAAGLALSLNGISFGYPGKEGVLHNVNINIPAGKTTAFVGPSGSGKTTIFALIERFYTPDSGTITLGHRCIEEFTIKAWRSQLAYVSQESPIMSGSIRDNILYGMEREVKDDEVIEAARLANAAEFIDALPEGYNTQVGERGIKLSGGQRQRIAIARALIRNPAILLLDEATSNLDSGSEALVQKALNHLMEGRTTLVIAHRLSTVVSAQQIAVVENGRITGIGTHQELLKTHELYRELALQQMQGGAE